MWLFFDVLRFITAVVCCVFEHIVADMLYISCYGLSYGVQVFDVVKVLTCVTAGNTAGGLFISWAVRELDKRREQTMDVH